MSSVTSILELARYARDHDLRVHAFEWNHEESGETTTIAALWFAQLMWLDGEYSVQVVEMWARTPAFEYRRIPCDVFSEQFFTWIEQQIAHRLAAGETRLPHGPDSSVASHSPAAGSVRLVG